MATKFKDMTFGTYVPTCSSSLDSDGKTVYKVDLSDFTVDGVDGIIDSSSAGSMDTLLSDMNASEQSTAPAASETTSAADSAGAVQESSDAAAEKSVGKTLVEILKILKTRTDPVKGHTLTVTLDTSWSAAQPNALICLFADGTMDSFVTSAAAGSHTNVVAYSAVNFEYSDMFRHSEMMSLFKFKKLDKDMTITVGTTYMCLLAGTKIRLADGRDRNVEDVSYDDDLLVWDFDRGELGSAKPSWIKKAERGDYCFRNRYASGRELLATGRSDTGWAHRHFDVERGEFLNMPSTVGDHVYTLDGADRHVASEYVEAECEYYNILTARHFNMFANGVLTSCRLNNFRKIENMKFVGELPKERVGREEFVAAYLKLSGEEGAVAANLWYDALRCDAMPRARTEELAKYAFEREVIRK